MVVVDMLHRPHTLKCTAESPRNIPHFIATFLVVDVSIAVAAHLSLFAFFCMDFHNRSMSRKVTVRG